jgi:hypothetical protein
MRIIAFLTVHAVIDAILQHVRRTARPTAAGGPPVQGVGAAPRAGPCGCPCCRRCR